MTRIVSPTILVKGTAGLGNRMLAAMTASLFATVTNRRLMFDWRDPIFTGKSGVAPDLFTELFTSPLCEPLPATIEADSVAPALWQGRLNETLAVVGRDHDPLFYKKYGSFRKLAASLKQVHFPEQLLVFWSWREVLRPLRKHLIQQDSRYRNMSNRDVLREAANRFVVPCDAVRSYVDQFVAENFKQNMLGVHIRATDLQAPVEKLLKTAVDVVRRNQCDGVFCATDNGEVEDRARRLLPNVVTLPKELPKTAIPLHYDPDCQSRVERARQALSDILLLSKCQHLVYASRSSFGYVASLYASETQRTIDVDQYNLKIRAKQYLQSWTY